MEDNMEMDQHRFISGVTGEVTNLNIENLDVQELDRRLELTTVLPPGDDGSGSDQAGGPCIGFCWQ